jgi:hypothetical protein
MRIGKQGLLFSGIELVEFIGARQWRIPSRRAYQRELLSSELRLRRFGS